MWGHSQDRGNVHAETETVANGQRQCVRTVESLAIFHKRL